MAGSVEGKNLNLSGRVGEDFPPLGRLGRWVEKPEVLGYLLLSPAIIFLLVFLGYPFIKAIWITLLDKEVGVEGTFVGLKNYIVLWQDYVYRWTVSVIQRHS